MIRKVQTTVLRKINRRLSSSVIIRKVWKANISKVNLKKNCLDQTLKKKL